MTSVFKYLWLKYHLDYVFLAFWCLIVLASAYVLSFQELLERPVKSSAIANHVNLESIGQGPVALNPQYLNPHTPKVLDSFYVVAGSKYVFGSSFLHLGVNGSSQLQMLDFAEFKKIDIAPIGSDLDFDWYLKPIKIEKDLVFFEARHKDSQTMIISLPLINLKTEKSHEFQEFLKSDAINKLSIAKLSRSDHLFDGSGKTRAVCMWDARLLLSLELDEVLYFSGDKWKKEKEEGSIIAELKSDASGLFFNVIDQKGFFEHPLRLQIMDDEPFNIASIMPQNIKVYPSGVMSCQVGHQRLVLKKGDWVLKTHQVCQVLKSKKTIESLINYEKYGPLLVIEGIDINKNRSLVRGKIFSPLRIKAYPFEIEASVTPISKNMTKTRNRGVKKSSL